MPKPSDPRQLVKWLLGQPEKYRLDPTMRLIFEGKIEFREDRIDVFGYGLLAQYKLLCDRAGGETLGDATLTTPPNHTDLTTCAIGSLPSAANSTSLRRPAKEPPSAPSSPWNLAPIR